MIVTVWQKPYTREDREGFAKLVHRIGNVESVGGLDYADWLVDFSDDYGPVRRTICPERDKLS